MKVVKQGNCLAYSFITSWGRQQVQYHMLLTTCFTSILNPVQERLCWIFSLRSTDTRLPVKHLGGHTVSESPSLSNNAIGQTSWMTVTIALKTRGRPTTHPASSCCMFLGDSSGLHCEETSVALLCDWGEVDIPPLQDPDGGVMAAVFKLSYRRGQESEWSNCFLLELSLHVVRR